MQINPIQAIHSTDGTQYRLASLMCSLLTFTKGKYNPPRTLTFPHYRTFTPVPEQCTIHATPTFQNIYTCP